MVEVELTSLQRVRLPTEMCANCGARDQPLLIIDTTLRWTLYLGVFGTERRVRLPLPYCDRCAHTAERRPMGLGGRALVCLLLWILGIMAAPSVPGIRALGVQLVLVIDAALAAAIVWAWAAFASRPGEGQTSAYQPVRLRDFGRILAFTNGDYAARFVAENPRVATLLHADVPQVRQQGASLGAVVRAWSACVRRPSARFHRNAQQWGLILIAALALYALAYYLRGRL